MALISKSIGRAVLLPLLLLNLAFAIIIIGLGGHYLDWLTIGKTTGNGATLFFIVLSLIGAAAAAASYIATLHHLRVWSAESGGGALGSAWTAWFLLILAFCLGWKEIEIGRNRPSKLKALEAFVIILTATHFLFTVLLHPGDRGANTTGTHKPANPNAATPAQV